MRPDLELSSAEKRQKSQLEFENGNENIIVGNIDKLPLPVHDIKLLNENSAHVEGYFNGGLTAKVFKIYVDGGAYTIKLRRPESGVKNIDGQTSFLNEVQRRRDFESLKICQPNEFKNVVNTVYANYREGIIVSTWIEGDAISYFDKEIIGSLYDTLFHMESEGIFEYDLNLGNFLVDESKNVWLYDFGYCYRFDPLTQFNPDGITIPLFNHVERFETRAFMPHLFDVQTHLSMEKALSLYRIEKTLAVNYYKKKLALLKQLGAHRNIVAKSEALLEEWRSALTHNNNLLSLYRKDQFRSFLIDVHDDISGKYCSPDTMMKIETVIDIVDQDFDFIKAENGFFWGDENKTKDELLKNYDGYRTEVSKYQVEDLSAFQSWKKQRIANLSFYK